ncbi:MAG: LlaJI family restriction endonuclease, partial [Pedobacter sp.]
MNKFKFYIEQRHYSLIVLFDTFSKEDIINLELKGLLELFDSGAKFTFVGVISIRNSAFMIVPKVLKEVTSIDSSLTLKTLQKYTFSNTQLFDGVDYFSIEPDHPECSELAIAQYLLNDYEKNGLYFTQEQVYSLNGDGYVNWNSTIESLDPVFSNNQPIYVDTINHIFLNVDNNIIVEIHKWSLKYS